MHCPPYSNVLTNFYSYNNNRFALDFTSTYLYIKGVIKIQVNLTMNKANVFRIIINFSNWVYNNLSTSYKRYYFQ